MRTRWIAWVVCGWLSLVSAAWTAPPPRLLVMGDSLSAGYGLDAGQGWVALLQQKLRTAQYPHQVINDSISGETTSGGLARLPAALDRHKPAIVLIELGANDGLRALSVKSLQSNLGQLVDLSRSAGAKPLLFEMRIPANYGPAYAESFYRSFADTAKVKDVPLVPFFLGSIATDLSQWFQEDGIHPNAAAQPKLLEAVWPSLVPLLDKTR